MIIARQSTARTVMVGPILDADGVAVTGGVVGDLKISKNGGAPGALDGSATLTHRHTGHYSLALTANDLDTVGTAEVVIDDTTNACPMKEITVIEEAVYDILYAASATGAVPVASIANGAITAAAIATDAIDADAIADNAINAAAIASDAITAAKIATGAITAAKFAAGAIDAAAVAADAGTEIATAVWASGTRTLTAGTNVDGSTFTAIPWNASWDAEVQSEVDDALVARRLDELLNADSDIDGAQPPTVGSVFHELMTKTTGSFTFDQTTDSLEAIADGGGSGGATAQEVWEYATRSLTVLDEDSTTLDLDATIRAAVGLASANLDTQLDALPTAAETTTAVWAAAARTLTALDEDDTTLDLDATIRAAVGLASANLDTQLDALPTTAEVNAEVDTALADVGLTTTVTGRIDAAISTRSTVTTAQVNTEVLDVLNTDTFAQPTGVPGATATLADKLGRIYQALTSELTITSSAKTFFTHGASALWKKTLSDDGTTYTESDAASP